MDLLNIFRIFGFFLTSTSPPNKQVSLLQTLSFERPAVTAAEPRSPAGFSARALTVLR